MGGIRKWTKAHRKIATLVVLAGVWGVGMTLFVSLGHPLGEVLSTAAMWAVYTAALWYVQARSERKTESKLDSQGGMLVYIRYPDSRPGSLSGIWNMGVATFDETTTMKFQPAVYDTLEPSGRPTIFSALTSVSTQPGKIDRKEHRYITHQGFQFIRLTTDKGDIEVAARPESLRRILDVIRQDEEMG